MENWLRDRLSVCLDFEIPDDMIKFIMSIKTSSEFDGYFETLLNKECEEHRLFLADCKQRLYSKPLVNKKVLNTTQQLSKKQVPHNTGVLKQNHSIGKKADEQITNQLQQSTIGGSKKKTKYVSLYANDGKTLTDKILLKGRRVCECQASEHKLINNCLSCGRIVCEQEGSGPCLFCGELVCTNEEMQLIKSSKKGGNLMKSLKEKGGGETLKKAIEQRDRLLEYDRNSEKRTTVIDDELDYFQENSVWLSDAEREKFERLKQEMHEKKHGSRIGRQIKIDFAGREIEDDSEEYEKSILKQINETSISGSVTLMNLPEINPDDDSFSDLNTDVLLRPIYIPMNNDKNKSKNPVKKSLHLETYNRVQDKELLEMQDLRQCLSLHQPYASLLVAGIKQHEGRVWYTGHRGRLWIASTTKEPHKEEIEEMKTFYRELYDDSTIKFPETYPTGCLLGCVKLEECLPQEEYREIYPNGESYSPYVFICSNPQQLPVIFPIKGEHKIYKIDPKIHTAALKFLMRQKSTSG